MTHTRDAESQSVFQRRVPWAIAFVLGSAIVGPVILAPPWWEDHRLPQQLGFTIGVVAWGLVAVGLALAV